MSAQMIEILILALVAIVIITKLLSILGTTDKDDPARKMNSFFGEPSATGNIKDVTGLTENIEDQNKLISFLKKAKFSEDEKQNDVIKNIYAKIIDFDHNKFLRGAQKAHNMIIKALVEDDKETLASLVDKRFIEEINSLSHNYKKFDFKNLSIQFEDTYSFGNNIYIKLLITASKVAEYWIFTRNLNNNSKDWALSNIEALQNN